MARNDIIKKEKEFRQWAEVENKSLKELAELLQCSKPTVQKYAELLNIQYKKQKADNNPKTQPGMYYENAGLIVLERDYFPPFKSHESAWKCQCVYCGEEKTYRKSNLDQGIGCQCVKDIAVGRGYRKWNIGDRFGFLEIIGYGKNPKYVKCKCDCGVEKDVRLQHLYGRNHSRTISCGCSQRSSGELKILNILQSNDINFKEQYCIPELSKYMKFDFAIFDDENEIQLLIEYNGEQHYNPIEKWGGEEKLAIQQERDNRKIEYCKNNNIPLLVIPYWEYDRIDLEYILSAISN